MKLQPIDLVRQGYPQAHAVRFSASNDWEIYENENTETCLVLGSGGRCPTTPEQDEVNFGGTEEAAWLDALININAWDKFRPLACDIVVANGLREHLAEWQINTFIRDTARKIYDVQVPFEFRVLAEQMRTQDNACTADPIFIVYEKKRIYGMDTDYADENIVWINADSDYREADERSAKALDRYYKRYGQTPRNWQRTAYIDRDEYDQAFFTREAAQGYIRRNGHNLKNPHIYVEHIHHRNWEMKAIRDFLEAL